MMNQVQKECCDSSTRPPKAPNVAQMLMGSTCTLGEVHAIMDDMLRVVSCTGTGDTTAPSADCMLQEAVNLEEGLRGLRDKLIMLRQYLWDC